MTAEVTDRVLGGLVRERSRFLEFARGRVGADAEDVLQIALTRAVLKVDTLRDETLARPWFFRILRNAIADHHAHGSKKNEVPADDVIDELSASVPPEDPCACPVTVLGTLRPEYADILRRVDVDETPLAEVATALDISANNAAVRLHRARAALREALLRLCATDSVRACVDCGCDGRRAIARRDPRDARPRSCCHTPACAISRRGGRRSSAVHFGMRMHSFTFPGLLLGSLALAACGGGAVEPTHPDPTTTSSPPPTSSASASASAAVVAPPITTPEQAARAFVDAIAKHDATAAARAADAELARGQTRAHGDVTAATLDGAALADEWPGIEDLHAALFWATFTTGARTEKILLAVDRETNKVIGLRDQALRDRIAAERRALAAKPQTAKGKLLSKPAAGTVRVDIESNAPSVGDKVELSRQVNPSLPVIGGSWIVIADTEVVAVSGRTVTLRILEQKSEMKINGQPLDHYTPGAPISLEWTPGSTKP